ncbi:Uncharacterised protein [Neisseria gonorrhoeae]|uniref:Uncharacterized protein n=1 Tax=Neisseria gonorrhoeae TaxID=485 RepID=A0A378W2H7_NEIGO|nr:Uncharacterised protein [Neisseria gonorrhoeae]
MTVYQAIDDIARRTADNHCRPDFAEGCKLVAQDGAYQIRAHRHRQHQKKYFCQPP